MPEQELMGGAAPSGLGLFIAELLVTATDTYVWASIAIALLVGALCLAFGALLCRSVGLVGREAPASEILGVGLGSGLVVVSAWWAALASGGRSAFTPVAISFLVAVVLAGIGQLGGSRRPGRFQLAPVGNRESRGQVASGASLAAIAAGAIMVIIISLLYGATLAPSPRDGVQPMAFADVAFYAVLGRDLATTGVESLISPSGFANLPGISQQVWYHWGEIWLAAALIELIELTPMAARYFVVLPLIVVAAAALTGTLVRRLSRAQRRSTFWFGIACSLFLAPVTLPGTFFSGWAAGFAFGVTPYGLSAIAVLLAIYCIVTVGQRHPTWALIVFVSSVGAYILPSHPVIAALAVVGFLGVWGFRLTAGMMARTGVPQANPVWIPIVLVGAGLVAVTVIWGFVTDHGLGSSQSLGTIGAFGGAWLETVALVYVGAGILLAIPVCILLERRAAPILSWLALGVVILTVFGAIAWGARIDDFNMFHVFFGGLAVFAVPVGAAAAWRGYMRLHASGRRRLILFVTLIAMFQLGANAASTLVRLQEFGPRRHNDPVATSLLAAIRSLPPDARLGYACRPFEEFSFVDSSLLAIDAHTGRRVVPLCFQADVFSTLNGVEPDPAVAAAGFHVAPQASLFPDAAARPRAADVVTFLKRHHIDYIFEDRQHLYALVPEAIPIATSSHGTVLRLP